MSKPSVCTAFLILAAVAAAPASTLAADANTAPAAAATPSFSEITATRATLEQLRAGGFVLYLRHGRTDNSRPDRVPHVDFNDCTTQRPLTAQGRADSARIGAALRQARIPIGEVHVSPLCRAKDSAAAALGTGQPYVIDNDLMYTANLTAAQKAPIIAHTRRLLSAPVAAGTNRLLIGHAPNLMDLIGYFPPEATLVVFRPQGSAGFTYVASILPTGWPDLLD
ncbi:histidine phosphatase family protein [Candidatus Thiodictyon syntrophicum]|jgi:phosphohistidine phosphatase SixA|uniref:Histidine phosphatase family protein n=1 Tax=Candidatus Thiodictyon syntrophicum TaxID=1166950 RepID=A0A2K8U566_9GAMM|nr:histidine phosphatase family protein [Candidatus Thiodictyon syntrophicum]AUB80733.1 histidine phosphatase family protein [Candidatus Thiodictyon syntrophicum]